MVLVFIRTLSDIGLIRCFKRFNHELKLIIERKLPLKISHFLIGFKIKKIPEWVSKTNIPYKYKFNKPIFTSKNVITFNFINIKKKLYLPIEWNNSKYPRLWQFNLHYFDWFKQILEEHILTNKWSEKASFIETLLDDWIENNKIFFGDGWNSYTTSLRIRNWIWVFNFCPNLINRNRINSLWKQICFLNSHKESFYGGNHYLENLTALIYGGLQFEGQKSHDIYKKSLLILRKELDEQILEDGGHFERSASYHFLILDRLVELGCYLEIKKQERPMWLAEVISSMTEWGEKVLFKNVVPIFNDSNIKNNKELLEIINFSKAYLEKKENFITVDSFRNCLIRILYFKNVKKDNLNTKYEFKKHKVHDLKDTGWIFFRPGADWQLVFKYKTGCPKYLPAHVHSDLMSLEVFKGNIPIITEVGTSTYSKCEERKYERSSLAHNVFQLGILKNKKGNINWIEPIEVWDSFRAGRKAKLLEKDCFMNGSKLIIKASHDGYKKYYASHSREIKVFKDKKDNLNLYLAEHIICKRKMAWRQIWHFGPNLDKTLLIKIGEQLREKYNSDFKIINDYYSIDFNKKIFRQSLISFGNTRPGYNKLEINFQLENI